MPPAKRARKSAAAAPESDVASAVKEAKEAAARAIEDSFLCSICTDLVSEPVSTSCGHNYCSECIHAWVDGKPKPTCPLCKKVIMGALSINTSLKTAIETNAGPLFLAQKEGRTQRFLDALVALDRDKAARELSPSVDLTRFVGDAAARLTPLLWACKEGWRDLVKSIVEMPNLDFNARSADGRSTLWYAADNCSTRLVPILLKKGCRDAKALARFMEHRWVFEHGSSRDVAIARCLLLAKDDSVLTLSKRERASMLEDSLLNGVDEVAVELFKKGFRMSSATGMLRYAAVGGCAGFIDLLFEQPKKLFVDHPFEYMQTALHLACLHGHSAAALALLENDADIYLSDNFKMTAAL